MSRHRDLNPDFTCGRCGAFVPSAPVLSGVLHRNHCPYCLWSRHLDLDCSGDRLSACRAPMRPVGLTVKRSGNRYGGVGELMVIHRCEGCGTLSINRIAADDLNEVLLEIYRASARLDRRIRIGIRRSGIRLLGEGDRGMLERQLGGDSAVQRFSESAAE